MAYNFRTSFMHGFVKLWLVNLFCRTIPFIFHFMYFPCIKTSHKKSFVNTYISSRWSEAFEIVCFDNKSWLNNRLHTNSPETWPYLPHFTEVENLHFLSGGGLTSPCSEFKGVIENENVAQKNLIICYIQIDTLPTQKLELTYHERSCSRKFSIFVIFWVN